MESHQTQLELTALLAEVPDSSMAVKAAKKERARGFAQLRRQKKAEERRKKEELIKTYVELGLSFSFYGEHEEAVSVCLKALELDPTRTPARECLVISYMHLEDYDSAQDHLIEALRDNPEDVWASAGLALYYWKAESNLKMAELLLNRALELDPCNSKAHSMLGTLLYLEERIEAAQVHFDQAILSRPENADAHFGRVMTYLAQNSIDEAEGALKLFKQHADASDSESADLLERAKEIVLLENEGTSLF